MTNKEAGERIEALWSFCYYNECVTEEPEDRTATDMAIKALEQEPK